ncbi:MAG: T9SS type A sorting domain-containing protein [Bacteroidota bacterium]
MKRLLLFVFVVVCVVSMSQAQSWDLVWKLTQLPFQQPQATSEVAIVKAGFDTDEDGWGELLCAWTSRDTNAIVMYEATADNIYELVWYYKFPLPANDFTGIAVGDLDNNGTVDIVTSMPSVVGTDPNPLRVWAFEWNGVVGENNYGFLNAGSGEYDPTSGWNFGLPDNVDFRPYGLTIEDIDKDGVNELICSSRTGDRLGGSTREVMVASVEGQFSSFHSWVVEFNYADTFGGSLYNATTGDLDNDGNQEIYAVVWDLFTMRIFECTGDKQYTEVFSVDELYSPQGIDYGALDAARVADVNNDGVNELYIAGTEPNNQIFIVTGVTDVSQMDSTAIKELYKIPVTNIGKFRAMYIADPDKDGKANLMIAGEQNGQIFSLEYKGTGDPADSTSWDLQVIFDIWTESGFGPTDSPTIDPRLFYGYPASDMDKDGKDEYAFVNYRSSFGVWAEDAYVWVIEIDVATDVHDVAMGIPEEFELMQNYPNPFNPSTTIPYRLPTKSLVRLEVFDVNGQQVATLVNGEKEAGYHRTSWVPGLASGTYFYRLRVEPLNAEGSAFEDVKKMILVK